MTTKTILTRKLSKETIPEGYYTIRSTVAYLKKFDIKISYDGLSYYRKLKVIDKPVRFKGHMDKYYLAYPLLMKILTARLLTAYLSIKLENLSKYSAKLPQEIYLQLPSIILKTYDAVWGFQYDMPNRGYRGVADLYSTLSLGMKNILDKTLDRVIPGISIDEFSDMLEQEARRHKKENEQSAGYKMLLQGK